jgi:hypothetical protein
MCLFVGNTQIQEGSEGKDTSVPTSRQYRQHRQIFSAVEVM